VGRIYQRARLLRVAWDHDLDASDLVPMGEPELSRDVHLEKAERHLALHVIGASGISLGLLAMRCRRTGDVLTPMSLAWPDNCVIEIEPLQSNQRRSEADDGA
jgi:hypothetical protein